MTNQYDLNKYFIKYYSSIVWDLNSGIEQFLDKPNEIPEFLSGHSNVKQPIPSADFARNRKFNYPKLIDAFEDRNPGLRFTRQDVKQLFKHKVKDLIPLPLFTKARYDLAMSRLPEVLPNPQDPKNAVEVIPYIWQGSQSPYIPREIPEPLGTPETVTPNTRELVTISANPTRSLEEIIFEINILYGRLLNLDEIKEKYFT